MENENQSTLPNLVQAILSKEVKFIISVVGFVVGVVTPYYQMKQDVALIQASIANINSNHEVHIQDLNQNIKDIMEEIKNDKEQIRNLQTQNAIILEKIK